jgi:nucleoside-diphosphate-sugar epimerase
MTSLLILGGTGIVGKSVSKVAIDNGFDVTVTGIETHPELVTGSRFTNSSEISKLEEKTWDVVFNVHSFSRSQSDQIYQKFKNRCGHFFILSTTLVYDRSGYSFERISTDHPKAKSGSQGGYVDAKLEVENFWEQKEDVNWTVLRPYHIIGEGSYLGCLPPHNRDPTLVDKVKTGELSLCDGGRIPLNIVNPKDIGKILTSCAGKSSTYARSYNAVNPQEVIASDYYRKIAEILGVKLDIKSVAGEEIWSCGEWTLTTMPHLYDVSDLQEEVGYVPSVGLEESLREAIDNHPIDIQKNKTPVHQRMHINPCLNHHRYFRNHNQFDKYFFR